MKLLIVVQARTGSTRLPGKVLLPAAGAPLLQRLVERLRAVRHEFELVVATTGEPADDRIATLCAEIGVGCFRGHPTDLLDRHYQAARAAGAGAVAKIPSDCPLIDPAVVERVLGFWSARAGECDYVSNLHPATWPDGNDVEVMSFTALEQAWREARAPFEREHTTPFLWQRPERFRCANVCWELGFDLSMTHRLTLDYPEDYALVAAVYERLWRRDRPIFDLADVLRLLAHEPELFDLNAHLAGVNWYRHHLRELHGAERVRTRFAPGEAPPAAELEARA
jgi:spore coat polysaccharide biosynthesis protein SpsF